MIKLSVSIDVPDLQQAEFFYVEALGCKKVRDQGEMIVLRTDNADIYLIKKAKGSKPVASLETTRSYERHWTPVHLDFLTNNVQKIVAKVRALGGTHEGGERGNWGEIAHCADPFGNGFCIINE